MGLLLACGFAAAPVSSIAQARAPATVDVRAPVRVTLRDRVSLSRPAVVLGDVADIDGDGALAQRLKSLPIGRLQVGGEPTVLDAEVLSHWITASLGPSPASFVVRGPRRSQVRLATVRIDGGRIARLAQDEMRAALRQSGLQSRVDLLQSPADVDAPAGRLALKVRPLSAARWAAEVGSGRPADTPLARRETAWVDVWVDDAFVRTVPVTLDIAAYGPAYVSAGPLPAGRQVGAAEVESGTLRVETVDWAGRGSLPLAVIATPAPADDGGLRLRHALAAGQALERGDVARQAPVVRGQQATLHARDGDIELESQVEVLEDGAIGQRVRVRRSDSRTDLVAEVTGQGRVELRP